MSFPLLFSPRNEKIKQTKFLNQKKIIIHPLHKFYQNLFSEQNSNFTLYEQKMFSKLNLLKKKIPQKLEYLNLVSSVCLGEQYKTKMHHYSFYL